LTFLRSSEYELFENEKTPFSGSHDALIALKSWIPSKPHYADPGVGLLALAVDL
jgi:hypothetical protein